MTPLELKQCRARLGLTQRQLAAELDVCRASVNRWEAGIHKIPRILTLALKQLEQELERKRHKTFAATKFLDGEATEVQTRSKELNDLELRRILWACLTYWNCHTNPGGDRVLCYSWIVRFYEAKFGRAFHHSKLRRLARLGFLAKAKSSRCGTRRYYQVNDPSQLTNFLDECKLELACSQN